VSGVSPFEAQAAEYDAWFDAHPLGFESEALALSAVLPQRPAGDRWVEVGVGTGRFASRLGIPLGIEPSEAMAARARRRGVRVIPGRAEALPLEDESADAVFFITTLCFVSDVDCALSEARRVLAPGGALVVGFLPRESRLGRLVEAGPPDVFLREARLLSTSDVLSAVLRAELHVTRIVQTLTAFPDRESLEPPLAGFDRGAFVVVRADRPLFFENGAAES
jgi:ubiquinone/menaquinone biosynthesis C-methylase UbiE